MEMDHLNGSEFWRERPAQLLRETGNHRLARQLRMTSRLESARPAYRVRGGIQATPMFAREEA
jgi:hypothetical protein